MEDHNSSFYYTNDTWDYYADYSGMIFLDCIIISLGVPLSALAIYVFYSLVQHDRAPAPVYIINLLVSDIIQMFCIIMVIGLHYHLLNIETVVLFCLYIFCLFASVAFMVCIALERYMVIAWPLWYHFKRPTRISVVVSVLVWILCLAISIVPLITDYQRASTIHGILFLLPIPVFIFCLHGTLRALSSSRLPADEKRRIVAVLVLVLLIYTLLFVPAIIHQLAGSWPFFYGVPFILLKLNPLVDSVLYIFIRKRTVDKLLASVCGCKLNCCE